jgi:hypothetical protein
LRFYKDDGKEYIGAESPKEVTLEVALKEIDKFPTIDDNFIGFVNEKEEAIQFVRFEENAWLTDAPILEKRTLARVRLTTEKVKDIVKKFFVGEDLKSSLNLRRLEHDHA